MTHSDQSAYNGAINSYLSHNVDRDVWNWELKWSGDLVMVKFEFVMQGAWDSCPTPLVFDLCEAVALISQHKYADLEVVEFHSIGFNAEGQYGCTFVLATSEKKKTLNPKKKKIWTL